MSCWTNGSLVYYYCYYYFHAKNSSKKSKDRIVENLQHHVDHTVIENARMFLCQSKSVFVTTLCGRLIGRFGCNDPLTQYFSLYRAVFRREVENKMIGGRKKTYPNNPHSHLLQVHTVGTCPTITQIRMMLLH